MDARVAIEYNMLDYKNDFCLFFSNKEVSEFVFHIGHKIREYLSFSFLCSALWACFVFFAPTESRVVVHEVQCDILG